MEQVVSIHLWAHGSMETEGVPRLLAGDLEDREEGFHNVPGQSIGKCIIVKRVENIAWDGRAVERHGHRGRASAEKLSVDGGVMQESKPVRIVLAFRNL
jgi:hypothetical protein